MLLPATRITSGQISRYFPRILQSCLLPVFSANCLYLSFLQSDLYDIIPDADHTASLSHLLFEISEVIRVFRRSAFFILLLLLLASPFSSSFADSFRFFASADGTFSDDAVTLTASSGKNYLFLPGQLDPETTMINYTGTQENVFLNGEPFPSGASLSCLWTEEENVLQYGLREVRFHVVYGSPGLPVLYIQTDSGSLEKINDNKKYSESARLVMTDASGRIIYDGDLSYIKMRGNASTKFPKKNYQIKLEKGQSLLGMGKARKWILSGNWLDKSFIRNELSFDLAEYLGIPFTPQHQQAELFINHRYMGLYLFSEKVEINNSRINIRDLEEATEKLNSQALSGFQKIVRKLKNGARIKAFAVPHNPEDITGGYLIEYESLDGRYNAEPSGFVTKRDISVVIKSPEYASADQAAYIASIMQGFENAIFAEDGIDPESGKRYDEFVDKQSLVKKYLLNEFIKNYDGNASSEFFFKPEDSISPLVYAGPVWDLDNSYADYAREYNAKLLSTPQGFFIGSASAQSNWWPNLYAKQDFYDAVAAYFNSDFRTAVEIILGIRPAGDGNLRSLEEYKKRIEKSAEMNYLLYPYFRIERGVIQTGETFQENMDYLRSFIDERMGFLDREWIENDERHRDLRFLVR